MSPDVTAQQREALERFKERHGRTWKSKLVAAWANGSDDRGPDGAHFRSLRNTIGLDGLYSLNI